MGYSDATAGNATVYWHDMMRVCGCEEGQGTTTVYADYIVLDLITVSERSLVGAMRRSIMLIMSAGLPWLRMTCVHKHAVGA